MRCSRSLLIVSRSQLEKRSVFSGKLSLLMGEGGSVFEYREGCLWQRFWDATAKAQKNCGFADSATGTHQTENYAM